MTALASTERVKLGFDLTPTSDGWPPVDGEWLWFNMLERSFEGELELMSPPWFVGNLAMGDVIQADIDDSCQVLNWRLVRRSGNDLIWLLIDQQDFWGQIDRLCDLGCVVENYQNFHFAVSVPPSVKTDQIDQILEEIAETEAQIAFPVWHRGKLQ